MESVSSVIQSVTSVTVCTDLVGGLTSFQGSSIFILWRSMYFTYYQVRLYVDMEW
jgi:hypothetical protein